jgi:hypothetical protein
LTLLLVACGSDSDNTSATTTTVGTKRIAAYITKVDVNEGELTYDEIQFLMGDEAKEAYQKDNPDELTGPDNDYYIVKGDATLKTVPIAPNAQVELNILAVDNPGSKSQGASVVELADAFVKGKLTPDGRDRSELIATRPFWITLKDNVVTKIEEQYTP